MSTTFYAAGERLKWTNDSGSDIFSGAPLVVGALVAIAETDIADGETGALHIWGIHHLPKATDVAYAQGVKVGWDDTAKEVVATGGTPAEFGYVYDAVVAEAATVPVLINR